MAISWRKIFARKQKNEHPLQNLTQLDNAVNYATAARILTPQQEGK